MLQPRLNSGFLLIITGRTISRALKIGGHLETAIFFMQPPSLLMVRYRKKFGIISELGFRIVKLIRAFAYIL